MKSKYAGLKMTFVSISLDEMFLYILFEKMEKEGIDKHVESVSITINENKTNEQILTMKEDLAYRGVDVIDTDVKFVFELVKEPFSEVKAKVDRLTLPFRLIRPQRGMILKDKNASLTITCFQDEVRDADIIERLLKEGFHVKYNAYGICVTYPKPE